MDRRSLALCLGLAAIAGPLGACALVAGLKGDYGPADSGTDAVSDGPADSETPDAVSDGPADSGTADAVSDGPVESGDAQGDALFSADSTQPPPDAAQQTFSVGGTMVGAPMDVNLLYIIGAAASVNVPIVATGAFVLAPNVANGSSYDVTIAATSDDMSCNLSGGVGTVAGADVTSVIVNCTPQTYAVGGTLSGLAADASVLVDDNGDNPTMLTVNGVFTFDVPVPSGGGYQVVVDSVSNLQRCTVEDGGAGVNIQANVTTVEIQCD